MQVTLGPDPRHRSLISAHQNLLFSGHVTFYQKYRSSPQSRVEHVGWVVVVEVVCQQNVDG